MGGLSLIWRATYCTNKVVWCHPINKLLSYISQRCQDQWGLSLKNTGGNVLSLLFWNWKHMTFSQLILTYTHRPTRLFLSWWILHRKRERGGIDFFLSDGIKQCQTFQLAMFHMSVYITEAVVLCDKNDGENNLRDRRREREKGKIRQRAEQERKGQVIDGDIKNRNRDWNGSLFPIILSSLFVITEL